MDEYVDVLIVGAGLSGIGAASHLQQKCPTKSFTILEARGATGGTWDLFRYPGIRSDSDMFTLGYSFRPWEGAKAIADGPSIREYIRDTAHDNQLEGKIRLNHRVVSANWSNGDQRWQVAVERTDSGETVQFSCGFLHVCSGYYRYDEGYTPDFPGSERFTGQIIHPQKWPEDLDYAGKRVVVIGSGATAVTLVPSMASTAAHVTMLQRSPSYIFTLPAKDVVADLLRKILPAKAAYSIVRWKNVLMQMFAYQMSRRRPAAVKAVIRKTVQRQLPKGYDVDTHFNPSYDPWDQRLCLVPDGDLFAAIRRGAASVATDRIKTFTETGIELESGAELAADIIVTATGLQLQFLGGAEISIDGQPLNAPESFSYKGMMLTGVPNMAISMGYTNASWTLKCDLISDYVCRLISYMDEHGYRQCVPSPPGSSEPTEPFLGLNAGYVLRSVDQLPKQGSRAPWKLYQNYPRDIRLLRHDPIDDGAMRFS